MVVTQAGSVQAFAPLADEGRGRGTTCSGLERDLQACAVRDRARIVAGLTNRCANGYDARIPAERVFDSSGYFVHDAERRSVRRLQIELHESRIRCREDLTRHDAKFERDDGD